MAHARFLLDNLVDSATLSADPVDYTEDTYYYEDFTIGPAGAEGFNASVGWNNGVVIWTPTGVDPRFYIANGSTTSGSLDYNGVDYPFVTMRVRLISGVAQFWEGNCWERSATESYTTGEATTIDIPPLWTLNEWYVLEWDFTKNIFYTSNTNITALRMDLLTSNLYTGGSPNNASFEIDWVRIANRSTEYSINNVKKIPRSRVFRAKNSVNQDINIRFDTPGDVSTIVLGRHNFSTNITYKVFMYSDDNYSVPMSGYTPTEFNITEKVAATDYYEWGEFRWGIADWGGDKLNKDNRDFQNITLWLDQLYVGVKTIKIELRELTSGVIIYCDDTSVFCDDTSVLVGGYSITSNIPYFELGRLMIGDYIEPAYNISFGHSLAWKDNTKQYRPSSGTLHSDIATSNREMNFSLNTIPEADRATLHSKLIDKGLSQDFYISLFPEDKSEDKQLDYNSIVKFTKVPKYQEFIHTYYKSNFTVEEV